MGTQISIKFSDEMLKRTKVSAKKAGFDSLQNFIRELLRQKLFEQDFEVIGGIYTYKASEKALARNWLRKGEDEAWKHLQRET